MYKFLYFDLDGTLFDFETASRTALKDCLPDLIRKFGLDTVFEKFKYINMSLWNEVEKGTINVDTLRLKRFESLFLQFNQQPETAAITGERYIDRLSVQAPLLQEAEQLLLKLRDQFRLGIITNGISTVQRKRLKISGLESWFDPIIISYDYGISKPDTAIFDIAVEKTGLPRESHLFIGDSITSDMAGADRAGIDFCWFNPGSQKAPEQYCFKYEIRELTELLEILKRNMNAAIC